MWFRKRIRRIGKVEAQTIFYIIHQNQMRQKMKEKKKQWRVDMKVVTHLACAFSNDESF